MFESSLFSGLSPEECEKFVDFSKPQKKTIKKGQIICDEGAKVNAFSVLLSGKLRAVKYRYDGTLDLIEIYVKNDIINLETVCTPTRISPVQLSAMDNSEIAIFHYKYIDKIIQGESQYNYMQKNIIKILANENIKKLYKIDILYKKSLRERILVYLRHMESRLGRSEFHIRMDREQFAQYLGVNRSALSNELSQMKKEKIIDFIKDYFVMLKEK